MDARYAEALNFDESQNSLTVAGWITEITGRCISQYVYMTPFFTQIRFGKWDDILNAPAVPASRDTQLPMWHFATRLAQARKHDLY